MTGLITSIKMIEKVYGYFLVELELSYNGLMATMLINDPYDTNKEFMKFLLHEFTYWLDGNDGSLVTAEFHQDTCKGKLIFKYANQTYTYPFVILREE